MKRHVTCFVEKAGVEPRILGTKEERYDHCTTRPVDSTYIKELIEEYLLHQKKFIKPKKMPMSPGLVLEKNVCP